MESKQHFLSDEQLKQVTGGRMFWQVDPSLLYTKKEEKDRSTLEDPKSYKPVVMQA